MKAVFERIFIRHWPRKVIALATAFVVWLLVNQTITMTRTISDVPVRIINIPPDKTAVGLLPNGLLNKRIAITITGNKSVVDDLRACDLEIVINADGRKESWIVTLDKRSLVSLNPQIDLSKHITDVTANDLFIKLSRLINDEVTVTINKPVGDPPKGYQYLDVWPKYLTQKISGPEEQVKALKERGLEITFNLNQITQSELDALSNQQHRDEVSFKIPEEWKKVFIPYNDSAESLNDPRAKLLRIDFLKQEFIPLGVEIPITMFFPLKYSQTLNPQTYSLATSDFIQKQNGLKRLTLPMYVQEVSQLFLEVVKDNLLLVVIVVPKTVQDELHWSVQIVDEKFLEDIFVKMTFKQAEENYITKNSEEVIRQRFREYVHKFQLFTKEGTPLNLKAQLQASTITLERE